jgi:hypothetical protein
MNNTAIIALTQGTYYILTGLWGLLHIDSFMAVTGPKFDIWLVKMVSVLIVVISVVLLLSGYKKKITSEIIVLAIGSAIGFIAIDIYYVVADRISEVYLLDALAELILIIWWIIALAKERRQINRVRKLR